LFGFLQQWRAQQQSTRAETPVRRPAARKLTKFRVLSDPADIARESFSETVCAALELCRVVKKDEVEARKRFGDRLVGHAPPNDRC
jgi:hypothetical protein